MTETAAQGEATLRDIELGSTARVVKVGGEGALRQHLLDMGLIPGAIVRPTKLAPMGDPLEVQVQGYQLTLRIADAEKIVVEPASLEDEKEEGLPEWLASRTGHPGLGEGGRFHVDTGVKPIPEDKLTFALAGNQNCGKTTLFNALTGSNQHVGNFPGVTVAQKSGSIKGHEGVSVIDLPGIYSLSPYSAEEIVSRQFILDERPTAIIDIVDATNIERNLYLTMQLMMLDTPMVLALNMMDEVSANGGSIRINEMEALLGIPVIPISAAKGQGISELVDHALHVARHREPPVIQDYCDKNEHGGSVHRCIHGIMHLIEDHAEAAGIPKRFAACKLIEGDSLVLDALGLDGNEVETIEHMVLQMEAERGLDRSAAMADMYFTFIRRVCSCTVVRPHESRERVRSQKIDRVLTGKYTAIPAFIAIMALVFWLTFNVIGPFLQDLLASGIDALTGLVASALSASGVNPVVQSLVVDGIFNGVGSVLSFAPIIVVLYFFLSILEDSGYMARVAFVMDKLLRRIGLSGRSIVPMLVGFGCSVPAIMSTRTLPSERDRKMTVMLVPFMSCTAKLPIYTFLALAFFPGRAGFVTVILYLLGVLMAVIVAVVSKDTAFKGEAVPFVMELPNYRMPGARNVFQLLVEKTVDFLQRAFTVIFLATILVWALQTFDFTFAVVDDPSKSMLAAVAGVVAPVFGPMGLGDWRVATSLISGFLAKESVVALMGMLYGGTAAMTASIPTASAVALLVFCLLYTPCVAAIAAVRRELGARWAIGVVAGQCVLAWVVAFVAYLVVGVFV